MPQCPHPFTGIGCVARVYTDLAVIELGPQGALVIDMVNGLAFETLQRLTNIALPQALPAHPA